MINAIIKEIELTSFFEERQREINTIYFGGGTPGILDTEEIDKIIQALKIKFIILPGTEITLEANPDDINPSKLRDWKSIGINRFSVGIQSFDDTELKWMNRAHDAKKSRDCLHEIVAAGFTNYSADLIYGSPLQTDESLIRNLNILINHKVPHLSCYALTVEEGTVLKKKIDQKKEENINEDVQARQFSLLVNELTAAGYDQYEISNFALPGYRSIHNSNYWKSEAYYGFGPSAHSFDGTQTRAWNIANNALYLQAIEMNMLPREEEILTRAQQQNEFIMLGLRTSEGINLEIFENKFTNLCREALLKRAHRYIKENLILSSSENLKLSPKGKFLADGIAADLFF